MGMQLNTGDTGRAVSPAADGSLYSKIFGSGCYVLSGGNELKAEIQSNNLIKIYDGDLIMQGRHSYIPASDSDNVTINNGSQGMNRKDLIVARYTKDSTGVEDVTLQVVQGMATSGAATAPGYTDGDILKGATAKDFPLYEVSLTGINITEVKKLFKVLGTNEDFANSLTELNGKLITGDFVQLATAGATKTQTVYKDIDSLSNYKAIALYCNYASGYYCNPVICSVEMFKTMIWIASDRRDNNQNYSTMLHYESDTRVKFVTVNADAALYGIR